MVYAIVAIVAVLAFLAGIRYGVALESDAFAELHKIKAALVKTGVKFETYLAGDVAKIHAEAAKVLKLPQDLGTFIVNEIKAQAAKIAR